MARKCPICGGNDEYGVCEKCGWVEDYYQEKNKDEWGGANIVSFNAYKDAYENEWGKDKGEA